MHLHYLDPHHFPSRASSSTSERGDRKSKKPSSSSSSASTHSGTSTSSSSSFTSTADSTSAAASTTRTSSSSSRRHKHDAGDRSSITRHSTLLSTTSSASSSTASSPSTPLKPKDKEADNQVLHALRQVAGERVRHSKCPPEYLEGIAHRDDHHVEILSGNEASTFFVKFLGGHVQNDHSASSARSKKMHGAAPPSQAIVFAVTVWDYDKKIVDYYMTWRGKTAYNDWKEHEVKVLDEEFRRVSRRIDKDYKQFRRAGSVSSGTSHRSHASSKSKSKRDRSRSPSSPRKSRPPNIKLPPPGAELPTPPATGGTSPDPPVSATSSVISLPYLTNVRGVPRGNRMPLMVTNPDRLSMLSEAGIDVLVEDPEATAKPKLGGWREETSEEIDTPVIDVTPPDTKTHFDVHRSDPSALSPLMKSSASVYSTETHSSTSSRSSNGDEKDLDDLSDLTHKFLIVNLGDKVPREGLSWHGLERESSTRTQEKHSPLSSAKQERQSPWIGPLAKPDQSTSSQPLLQVPMGQHSQPLRTSSNGSSDVLDEGPWGGNGHHEPPVVPLKPLMETLGYHPHGHAHHSDPNLPASNNASGGGYGSAHGHGHGPSPPVIPPGFVPSYVTSHSGSMAALSPAPSHAMHLGGYSGGATPRMSMMAGAPVGYGANLNPNVWAGVGVGSAAGDSPLSRNGSRSLPPQPVAYAGTPYMRPGY